MAAIWREDGQATASTNEPAFAAKLRQLVESMDATEAAQGGPHERRLLQRVRAALAAFEAGWVVLADTAEHDEPLTR